MDDPAVRRVLEIERLGELGRIDVSKLVAWVPQALLALRHERTLADAQASRVENL